jgi:hypothetical protein
VTLPFAFAPAFPAAFADVEPLWFALAFALPFAEPFPFAPTKIG